MSLRRASLAAALVVAASTLTACSTTSSRQDLAPAPIDLSTVRVDNEGRERIDVYLVGERRSWRLGRLEPGQARRLDMPRDIPVSEMSRMQLIVVAAGQLTIDPQRNPYAVTTLRQPIGVLTAQRWAFQAGQLKSLRQ